MCSAIRPCCQRQNLAAVPLECAYTRMSKANRRFYRTILLGLAALGVLIWTAIDQFGISRQAMADLLLGTLWVAGGTIVLAALCAGIWIGMRKLLAQDDRK